METKVCSRCGRELPLSEFNKCKKSPDGIDYWCRGCQKQYRIENAERIKENQKQYYQEHKEEFFKYRLENRERRNEMTRKWHESHKEHEKEYNEKYRKEHKEERNAYCRQYYIDNIDKEKKRKKAYANTLIGWVKSIYKHCVEADRKAHRIGEVLPNDYIDEEWIMDEIQKGCAYKDKCGTTDWRKVGVNRKDNSLPHTKSNCEPCCWECNHTLISEEMSMPVVEIKDENTIIEWGSMRKCMKAYGRGVADAINGKNHKRGHYFKTSQFYKKDEYTKMLEDLASQQL